jgi:hypothetical protein
MVVVTLMVDPIIVARPEVASSRTITSNISSSSTGNPVTNMVVGEAELQVAVLVGLVVGTTTTVVAGGTTEPGTKNSPGGADTTAGAGDKIPSNNS